MSIVDFPGRSMSIVDFPGRSMSIVDFPGRSMSIVDFPGHSMPVLFFSSTVLAPLLNGSGMNTLLSKLKKMFVFGQFLLGALFRKAPIPRSVSGKHNK